MATTPLILPTDLAAATSAADSSPLACTGTDAIAGDFAAILLSALAPSGPMIPAEAASATAPAPSEGQPSLAGPAPDLASLLLAAFGMQPVSTPPAPGTIAPASSAGVTSAGSAAGGALADIAAGGPAPRVASDTIAIAGVAPGAHRGDPLATPGAEAALSALPAGIAPLSDAADAADAVARSTAGDSRTRSRATPNDVIASARTGVPALSPSSPTPAVARVVALAETRMSVPAGVPDASPSVSASRDAVAARTEGGPTNPVGVATALPGRAAVLHTAAEPDRPANGLARHAATAASPDIPAADAPEPPQATDVASVAREFSIERSTPVREAAAPGSATITVGPEAAASVPRAPAGIQADAANSRDPRDVRTTAVAVDPAAGGRDLSPGKDGDADFTRSSGDSGAAARAFGSVPPGGITPAEFGAHLRQALGTPNDPALTIAAAPGSPAFPREIAAHVASLTRNGPDQAEIRLTPPELGEIRVSVQLTDNATHVTFAVAQPAVREALTQALPELRSALAASGLTLGDCNVSSGSPNAQPQQQSPGSPRLPYPTASGTPGTGEPQAESRPPAAKGNRLLDVFA